MSFPVRRIIVLHAGHAYWAHSFQYTAQETPCKVRFELTPVDCPDGKPTVGIALLGTEKLAHAVERFIRRRTETMMIVDSEKPKEVTWKFAPRTEFDGLLEAELIKRTMK